MREIDIVGGVKSLAWLCVSLLIVWLLAHPPFGLTRFDYFVMCCIPLGAFFAGKHWYNSSLFMIYGAICMTTYIPGYFMDRDIYSRFARDEWAAYREFLSWEVGTLAVAFACSLAGRARKKFSRMRPEECPQSTEGEQEARDNHFSSTS